jgi:hypothetical protein
MRFLRHQLFWQMEDRGVEFLSKFPGRESGKECRLMCDEFHREF